MSKLLRDWPDRTFFYCPACKTKHAINVSWNITGSDDCPTVNPSVLTTMPPTDYRCHLFIRNGKIEYCGDCSHDMKGKTVDMEDINETK